jgi:hypothetical protein
MEIRTFTNFWNMERKLYAIYDVSLPMPISLKVAGAFLATGIPWAGLMLLLNIPFGSAAVLWILPPVAFGYIASKPIFQKKTFAAFLISQAKFLSEPKRLAGFRNVDYKYDTKYRIITKIFTRNSKDN